jgi:hypothetical protein
LYDWQSGKPTTIGLRKDFSEGNWAVHVSIHDLIVTGPDAVVVSELTAVNDPGKSRSVTKMRATAKVIATIFQNVCVGLMIKCLPASASGIKMGEQPFNVHKTLFTEECMKEVFHVRSSNVDR